MESVVGMGSVRGVQKGKCNDGKPYFGKFQNCQVCWMVRPRSLVSEWNL